MGEARSAALPGFRSGRCLICSGVEHDARETSVARKNWRGGVLSDYRRDAAGFAGIVSETLRAYDLELAA